MKKSKAPTAAKKDLPAALLMLRSLPDQIGELQVAELSIDFTVKTVLLQNEVRLLADLKELTVEKIAWFKPSGRGSLGKLKRWLIKFAFSRSSGISTAATTSKAHLYSKSASRLSSPTGKSDVDCESGSSLSLSR